MRASLRTTSLAFAARAAAVRGAPIAAGVTAANHADTQDSEESDAEDSKQHNLAARAAYRAWRQGAKRYYHHHDEFNGDTGLSEALFGELRFASSKPSRPRLLSDFASPALIGKGGFGFVYAASSQCDGGRYALKVLPSAPKAQPPAEAQCMAALPPHRNIVRYHSSWREQYTVQALRAALDAEASPPQADSDAVPSSESGAESSSVSRSGSASDDFLELMRNGSGSLVMQMELVSAPTLQAILRSEMSGAGSLYAYPFAADARKALPAAVRWRWLAGVACGLQVVHEAGWVHNDVKPANIFCSSDGNAKLCDFGLAERIEQPPAAERGPLDTAPERMQKASDDFYPTAGTALYMAPERKHIHHLLPRSQAHSPSVAEDELPPSPVRASPAAASDTFSLGVVVAETHAGFTTLMGRERAIAALKEEATSWRGGRSTGGSATDVEGASAFCDAELLALSMLVPLPDERPRLCDVERMAIGHAQAAEDDHSLAIA